MILKQLQEKIGADMERETWAAAAHDCLAKLLAEKWNGKKINKRICDQFKERFLMQLPPEKREEVSVGIETTAQLWYLTIEGIGPWKGYDNRHRLFIGYTRDAVAYPAEVFEERDGSNGKHAKARNEQRRKLIQGGDLEKIAAAIEKAQQARVELDTLTEHGTPGAQVVYFARKLAGFDKD